jgi:hypothetical protein
MLLPTLGNQNTQTKRRNVKGECDRCQMVCLLALRGVAKRRMWMRRRYWVAKYQLQAEGLKVISAIVMRIGVLTVVHMGSVHAVVTQAP